MPKIERLYAYIAVDDPDDPEDEGVAAHSIGASLVPLVGADESRMLSLRPYAQSIATTFGRPLRLVVFEQRREVGRVDP